MVPPSATALLVRAKLLVVILVSVVPPEEPLPLHALKKANATMNTTLKAMLFTKRPPSRAAIYTAIDS
jgi:hypothetical protein